MRTDDDGPPRRRSAAATRERILSAANALFYAQGIRATSADRVVEKAGITKVTFYRHFPTKSDLVVAYLTEQGAAERAWFTSTRIAGDPVGSLHAIAAGIGSVSCSPGFRGCAFINAAAEFSDPDDPARVAVAAHRRWMLDEFTDIAAEAGAEDPQVVARQLMMLRDGAMVNGYVGEPDELGAALSSAFDAALAAAISERPAPAPTS